MKRIAFCALAAFLVGAVVSNIGDDGAPRQDGVDLSALRIAGQVAAARLAFMHRR